MPGCPCCAVEATFTARVAARDLARYHRQGPAPTTRRLLTALAEVGLAARSLLDIGGGIGVIAHEALRAGARRATLVDAASAYAEAARAEATRQGHADRLTVLHGDAAGLLPGLPLADLVTLDRVICCVPDLPAVLAPAAGRARWAIGLVFPREEWWLRLAVACLNAALWLRHQGRQRWSAWSPQRLVPWPRRAGRSACPVPPPPPLWQTVHPLAAVDRIVGAAGFARHTRATTPLWQIVVYTRA